MENVNSLSTWTASQFDPTLNWKDVEWVRKLWPGKLILKGILDPDDAKRAAKTGADAIIVSNHGGRQLDGTSSSISMLPKVADAVGVADRDHVRRRRAHRPRHPARARARREKLHDRPRLCLGPRRRRTGGRRQSDRHPAASELDVNMALCGVKNVRDLDRSVIADDGLASENGTAQSKAKTRARKR